MIRITGGTLKGRQIESPKDERIRPTSGKVRESIFSSIQFRLADCRFLDLFAGSGLMGLEALSRGAEFVMAVENHRPHMQLIENNYARLGLTSERFTLVRQDVVKLVSAPCPCEAFEIVFLDPPYGFGETKQIVAHLEAHGWVRSGGVIIAEQGRRDPELPGFVRKQYGDTAVSLRHLPGAEEAPAEAPHS